MRPRCRRAKKGALEHARAGASHRDRPPGGGSGPVAGLRDAGLEAAEAVIRAGMLHAGAGLLGRLLASDPGYRGPRAACGNGHQAGFVAYRGKIIDTVLGPVTLARAWYHCAACGHGLAPRDADLGVAGAAPSPAPPALEHPSPPPPPLPQARP